MASTLNLDGRAPCSGFKWLCNCGPAWTPFMGKMFQCSADCCENANASMEEVHQCIERCHAPLAQAQATVTGELERFQYRQIRPYIHHQVIEQKEEYDIMAEKKVHIKIGCSAA
ncbi:protein FAM136A isoform X2 [Stegostoma tigrinum]|uniref:protein FAM136A isoform X2 n=1 Tax=Stegostoma tigrinum TaxID=3053191 RepID=UPI00286FD577|nr:protein FAM136A isoform X2 [Stegostoma tigrinum]